MRAEGWIRYLQQPCERATRLDEDLHHEVLGWLVGDGVLLTKRVGKEATIVRAHREVTPEEGKEMEEKALLALLPRDESGFSIQDILKRSNGAKRDSGKCTRGLFRRGASISHRPHEQ